MTIDAALVKEQGVTFAVVAVKLSALTPSQTRASLRADCQRLWPGVPIVLMAQDSRGVPTYHGRHDIVRYLSRIPLAALPWKTWALH
jgi:hypothetical protein